MGESSLLRSPLRPMLRPSSVRPFATSSSFSSSSSSSSVAAPVSASFVTGGRSRIEPDEPVLSVFGSVPSEEEAEAALSSLKQVFIQFPLSDTSREEIPSPITGNPIPPETSMETFSPNDHSNSTGLRLSPSRSNGLDRIHNSLDLLNRSPSIQKLVLSLSTDKAIWDAIMKNETVQELHHSFLQVGRNEPLAFVGQDSFVPSILNWIIKNAKMKIVELIDQISDLLGAFFHSKGSEETTGILNDVIKSSFMLTVMVLLVVIVSRLQIESPQ